MNYILLNFLKENLGSFPCPTPAANCTVWPFDTTSWYTSESNWLAVSQIFVVNIPSLTHSSQFGFILEKSCIQVAFEW